MTVHTPSAIRLGETMVDLDGLQVTHAGGQSSLSTLEARFLQVLLSGDGATVSHAQLMEDVWAYHPNVRSRASAMLVSRLRRKIEPGQDQPVHLLTVRGVGFRLVGAVACLASGIAPEVGVARALRGRLMGPGAASALAEIRDRADHWLDTVDDLPPDQAAELLLTLGLAERWERTRLPPQQLVLAAERTPDRQVRCGLVQAAAHLVWRDGDPALALRYLQDHLQDDPPRTAAVAAAHGRARILLLDLLATTGRHGEARALAADLRHHAVAWCDPELLGMTAHPLAALAEARGDLEAAAQHLLDGITQLEAANAPIHLAWCLHGLGLVRFRQGHVAEARPLLQQAAAWMTTLSLPLERATVQGGLSLLAAVDGRHDESMAVLDDAVRLASRSQGRRTEATLRIYRGRTHLLAGRPEAATTELLRARHLHDELQQHRVSRRAARYLGAAAHLRGDSTEARRHYDATRDAPGHEAELAEVRTWNRMLDDVDAPVPCDAPEPGLRRMDRVLTRLLAQRREAS
ncbi:MAG: winged helix-turn-helix domain-containing protein [Alphaproteobacteria bacterium]|nr:winged helix-turn-helix domain-containing protein [Alphaproteobacteria bacterium]